MTEKSAPVDISKKTVSSAAGFWRDNGYGNLADLLFALRDALDRAEARIAETEACLDAAEKESRISDNGDVWRFWASKCRELAQRLGDAEKENSRVVK